MKQTLLIFLLAVLSQAYTPFPECQDDTPGWTYDGYCWHGAPIPGLPDYTTQFLEYPPLTIGKAVFYSPYVMEATARYRGLDLAGYVGGVATMTCGNLGKPAWLRRPGLIWEGPFLVVDCARRNDLYGITMYYEEAIEVDFKTALRWDMIETYDYSSGDYEVKNWMIRNVLVSIIPPNDLFLYKPIIPLNDWLLSHIQYSSGRAQDWKEYRSIMLPTLNRLTP